MKVLVAIVFLQMVPFIFGRPDLSSLDPISRIARSPQGNASRNNRRYDGTIIFPHDEKHATETRFATDFKMPTMISNSCENDICEEVGDYPVDYIENILSQSTEFQDYFARQEVTSFSVSDRVGIGEVEETLCTSSVRTLKPKLSKNYNGTFVTVVNTEKYQQLIVTETCESSHGQCKFADTFPNNYETGCKQKYTNHRLIAFDNSGHFFDVFPVPSCCVCYYKKKSL